MSLTGRHGKHALISILRNEIDSNSIQGFILASSDQLVVLQYVYDFNLDGLMVLSRSEITEIRSTATDKFQRKLLAKEGVLKNIPFETTFDLQDWRSIIKQFAKAYPLIIFECERGEDPELIIGRVEKTTSVAAYVRYFTGTGRWLDEPVRVKYSDITSCQVGTNYLEFYERYFDRVAP
jgi:hypothetical protein